MAKPKKANEETINEQNTKRATLPRKVKEQYAINLDKQAVTLEIIEVSSAVEMHSTGRGVKLKKQKFSGNGHILKNVSSKSIKKVPTNSSYKLMNRCDLNATTFESDLITSKSSENYKNQFFSKTSGLTHFMELGERTDLTCNRTATDPLGPDSFNHFQWVDVKKELLEDIELSNVKFTELPLNALPAPPISHSESPNAYSTSSGADGVDPEIQDRISSYDDSCSDEQESENIEVKVKKKNRLQDCNLCGKNLSSKSSLRLHKLKKHKEKTQFECDLCDLKFDLQRQVVRHRNSVHREEDGRFCCKVCCKRFIDYHNFLPHIKNHLNNCTEEEGSDKACRQCQKTFKNDESLRIHETLTHTIDEQRLRDKLKKQEKNYICDTCGKQFAFNCLLRDHINLHTGSKPYLCQKCGKSFCQKATLKQHAKTHNDVRPHQCPECPMGFFGGGDLKKHLRKHTGERPYGCEVCGERFSRSSHLLVHRRSHTGERPHVCDVCGRGFTKRGDVVRHRRIHTGELPYMCQTCGKAFRQSTQCANHIKSQHPDMPVAIAKNPNPTYLSSAC